MGCSLLMQRGRCSQGGGVFVESGKVTFQSTQIYNNHADDVSFPPFEHPIAPMGCSLFMPRGCCLQGGGVFINNGDVHFTQTNIYSNTAQNDVCARF